MVKPSIPLLLWQAFAGRSGASDLEVLRKYQQSASLSTTDSQSVPLQGDGSELGQEHVHLDGFAVQQALRRHLLFWSGNKPPEMVPITEDWKCRPCLFAAKCPTGQGLARRPS